MNGLNDLILQTTTKVTAFLILSFSLYLFIAGHNATGGGFVGGLMTSAALVLLFVSYGYERASEVLPVDFKLFIPAGLLIAVLTGVGSFVFDQPFLSHTYGYIDLPFFGEYEWATALLFDLGVYLTVVGVTMTIILSIAEDDEKN
ncbi:Na(+)/H(+) antiporter subunit B [Bacillaceae bacterium SIJ1]|uniref:Na(+)/H(+) antiporter subunit B n=1 Tax=Litoribacterium kuwaitense TaxID=1398745 RepID=UPI0013EB9D5A|nr:Na(+)/H(+) antiporter subunit B [Litoribacterium kuwaitense]NGP44039.1 Na(+)/H(+) antiporter subunit B [Litoribacterium kuwaitense]